MAACANPDCTFTACGDPEISVAFCCEKCEGRFNGEEWAMGGKKKHTAYCTGSGKTWDDEPAVSSKKAAAMGGWGPAMGAWGGAKGGKGKGPVPQKCGHPECEYLVHSDPSWIPGYCCEKCKALAEGDEWAEGGKRHYKHCEKRTMEDFMAGGAGGGADAWGPYGGAWGGKAAMWDPWMAKGMMMKGWGKDPWGGKGGMDPWGAAAFGKAGGAPAAGGKGKGGKSLDDFSDEQKLAIGGIPEGATGGQLLGFFKENGAQPKWAEVSAAGDGTGGVAFATEEHALEGIMAVSGLPFKDAILELGAWGAE